MSETHWTYHASLIDLALQRQTRREASRCLATGFVVCQMHRRRQIQPVTTITQWEAVELLRNNGFTVDQARLDRVFNDPHAQPVHGNVSITMVGNDILGLVKGTYHARIVVAPAVDCDCDCPDWLQSGGKANQLPCKHILGLAVDASLAGQVPQPGAVQAAPPQPVAQPAAPITPLSPATPGIGVAPPPAGFPNLVARAIADAVEAIADKVEALLVQDEVPFLIGPTDCGKTSAVRRVAVRNGWRFEPVEGCESFADADLVGIVLDGKDKPGPFARAFSRARETLREARAGQQRVLLFLDEATRFNQRALDIIMTPLLPTAAEVARLMGIDTDEDVRYIEAPIWGREWAPLRLVPMVMACNPWGSPLDPATVRRVIPVEVDFASDVANLFRSPLKDAITTSWQAVKEGRLPLPIGYKTLRMAQAPDDRTFLPLYLARLRAVDRAAGEGYQKILEGMGIRL
jgi:hypothetical protein